MNNGAYYNEKDGYCAAWLRNLMGRNLIPPGDVDERSIADVQPDDIDGYTQCHFFAGLGGWAYAARLAGWPDERLLWTGSCPCQPFSAAGKGRGADDERHLWPDFFRLIRSCRPPTVMGEQVAGKAGYGWLDGVRADLAGEGYACRGVDIPACAVDAPHIRSRLYWVTVANTSEPRRQGRIQWRTDQERSSEQRHTGCNGSAHSPWSEAEWLIGADGKSRRAKPGIRLLASGVPARVSKLRALGNAIVPRLASEVIAAFMEAE